MDIKSPDFVKRRKRSTWSKKEDKKLKQLVEEVHETSWVVIAKYFKNRTNKDCRDRYMLHLSPNIEKRKWTQEEEDQLLMKYEEFGPKWVKISRFFEKRSPSDLKNRYNLIHKRNKLPPTIAFPSFPIFEDIDKTGFSTTDLSEMWKFTVEPF